MTDVSEGRESRLRKRSRPRKTVLALGVVVTGLALKALRSRFAPNLGRPPNSRLLAVVVSDWAAGLALKH